MKTATKDLLHGGLFALIAHLSIFLLFTVSIIFPFDWFQQLTMICSLLVPGSVYYIFVQKRTLFCALGMLACNIVVIGICLLLGHTPLAESFIGLIKSLAYGDPGLLFDVQFAVEFMFRIVALTCPPIIHLIVHAVGLVRRKRRQRSAEK